MSSIETTKSGVAFSESFFKELDDNGVLVRNRINDNGLEMEMIEFTSFDGKTLLTITQILNPNIMTQPKEMLERELEKAIEAEDFETASIIKSKIKNL